MKGRGIRIFDCRMSYRRSKVSVRDRLAPRACYLRSCTKKRMSKLIVSNVTFIRDSSRGVGKPT